MRIALLLALIFTLTSQLPAQKNPPSEGREVTKLYADTCAGCHGADLSGGSAPSLLAGSWNFSGDDAALTNAIQNGRDGTNHAFRQTISRAETRALVVYIHEKQIAWQRTRATYPKPAPEEAVNSEKAPFKLEPVVDAGLVEPWSLAFLPDGRLLVTERAGRLRIVDHGKVMPEVISGVPAVFGGEGGLLDVALHPNYPQPGSDWVYLTYGVKNAAGSGMTAVLRGRLRNNQLVDQQQIFLAEAAHYRPGGQRFGSRLLFDGHGHLFFSIGDRAAPGDEQDLSRPNGKIHRLMDDGRVPPDNPFVHRAGALPSIWSYGHRNPQGLSLNPLTGVLWASEHGPRGGDELNVIEPGHNYGWPVITYGINYDGTPITDHTEQPGMQQPITYWVPSLAVSAMAFYTGNRIPEWKNNLFLGSLAAQELRRLEYSGNTVTHQEILFKNIGRIRDVINGPDGFVYVILNEPDRIMRLTPTDVKVSKTSE